MGAGNSTCSSLTLAALPETDFYCITKLKRKGGTYAACKHKSNGIRYPDV